VHADFQHTAYRWPLESQHYADSRKKGRSGYWIVPHSRCSPKLRK
jgi:hypothetical protein